jgi:hypothetical protein
MRKFRCGICTIITAGGLFLGAVIVLPAGAAVTRNRPGIGSTLAQWKHAYQADHQRGCGDKNSCFGAPIHDDTSGRTYQFTNVSVSNGVISGYDENFFNGTTIAEAKNAIESTLPLDAKLGPVIVDTTGGSCGLITTSSPTLQAELNTPKIGDTAGTVGIEFNRIDANINTVYSPTNVQNATVSILPEDPTAAC